MLPYASANGDPAKIADAIKAQVDHVITKFGVAPADIKSRVRSVSKISGYTQRDIDDFARAVRLDPQSPEADLCKDRGVSAGLDERGTFFRPLQ